MAKCRHYDRQVPGCAYCEAVEASALADRAARGARMEQEELVQVMRAALSSGAIPDVEAYARTLEGDAAPAFSIALARELVEERRYVAMARAARDSWIARAGDRAAELERVRDLVARSERVAARWLEQGMPAEDGAALLVGALIVRATAALRDLGDEV